MPAPRARSYDCPIRDVLDRIGDAWSVLVLTELGQGDCRFNALGRVIDGISARMLAVTLRNLTRDGLVTQRSEGGAYGLTPLGRSLLGRIEALADWAREAQPEVRRARSLWDEAQETEAA